eukprot:TRINITY_DN23007_c0_g1_i4.p1 TRINITY_DN23007_c0_g1~~TRINITY_DN23007_c0_g1_i4.p1  ORF type:complete len:109 (-),score=35.53 TRINITY_DN23007_c0_g1_i4:47-373(-)
MLRSLVGSEMCIRDRQCISTLEVVLKQVVREGVVLEADVGYRKTLSSVVIPHVVTTLKTLFPVFAADTRVYDGLVSVSYTHLRAHETPEHLVCRLLLEKKKKLKNNYK